MRLFGLAVFAVLLGLGSSVAIGQPARAVFLSDPSHVTSISQLEALESPMLGGAPVRPRRMLQLALDLVKDFEKWIPSAYNDASQYCTIGYGHLVARQPCERSAAALQVFTIPIPLVEGLRILENDTILARSTVQTSVRVQLSDEQFGALASFVFNVGANNFKNSTLLRYLNDEKPEMAVRQFSRWILSAGKVLPGLANRRSCEVALFRGRLELRSDGSFNRADCQTLGGAPLGGSLIDLSVGEK